MKKTLNLIRHLLRECFGGWRIADGISSKIRLAGDFARLRFYRLTRAATPNRVRRVRIRGGGWINYRLNAGDLQGIREVWLDDCYRVPPQVLPETVVDLGGNIGLTSLWYATHYSVKNLVIVEPDACNADLIRSNMQENDIIATVIEAAVGPQDGMTDFLKHKSSNMGRVPTAESVLEQSSSRIRVPMVSMKTVLAKLPAGSIVDLLKVDIEGGEELLFSGELDWLERIRFIIAELHPPIVDLDAIVATIESKGFKHLPPGSVFSESMTMFERM